MSFAAEAIRKQDAKMQAQHRMWSRLMGFLDRGELAEFWTTYTEHLEQTARETGFVSDERAILIRAMKASAEKLK